MHLNPTCTYEIPDIIVIRKFVLSPGPGPFNASLQLDWFKVYQSISKGTNSIDKSPVKIHFLTIATIATKECARVVIYI